MRCVFREEERMVGGGVLGKEYSMRKVWSIEEYSVFEELGEFGVVKG